MEINLPILDDENRDHYFAILKLLIADEYVFFDGIEQVCGLGKEDCLEESTFNSIIANPGDITLRFPTKQLYVLAKTIISFYEIGGVRDEED